MATPVTIYYESQRNATKEDRKRSLTPSFIDGIIDPVDQSNILQAVEDAAVGADAAIQSWVEGWFNAPKSVVRTVNPDSEATDFITTPYQFQDIISSEDLDVTPVINTLAFHANIGETHSAQSEITKFPTQAGFEISNHAIRKNRVIEVEAIITNTLLNAVGSRQLNYGLNNSTIVFEAIESLVNSGTVCSVSTNLGIYWPVVFTKFKTKQELGMVDSMKFTLVGEEILVDETISETSPKQLTFTRVTGSECDKLASNKVRDGFQFQCACSSEVESTLDSIYGVNPGVSQASSLLQNSLSVQSTSRSAFLRNSLDSSLGRGLINRTRISKRAVISADLSEDSVTESNVPPEVGITDLVLGEDFQVEGTTTSGKLYTVTYKVLSYDYTAKKHKYEVHTNDTDVYVPDDSVGTLGVSTQAFGIMPSTDSGILGASKSVSNCLLLGAGDLACQKAQDLLDTGMGKMRESIYGVITDVVNMGGIDGSDSILGMSLDCVSAEVYGEGVGFEEAGDLLADDIDNATNRIMSGAAEYGGTKRRQLGEYINTKTGPAEGRITKPLAIPKKTGVLNKVTVPSSKTTGAIGTVIIP